MEWKIENRVRNAKGQVLLQVHVPAAEFAKQLELAFTEALPELDLPGADKKTVTRAQAEAVLGAQYFYPAAAQRCCQQALQEALEQLELETVGYPAFSSCGTDPTGLRFTAVLDLYPQATLGEYKDMRPQLDKPTVTEEEVEQTLELFAARAAEEKTLDRPAALGDSVRLDLEGFADGKAFAGGKAEDYPLELGSHTFIPGLEEGIVGLSAGEERDVPVTFPQNYSPELAGRDYDCIVATYSLHHLADGEKVRFLRELQAHLRPGGAILIGDVAFATRAELAACQAAAGESWDEEEVYFVADELREAFPQLRFVKLSPCAGLLTLEE